MKSMNYKSIIAAVLSCILSIVVVEQLSKIYLFTVEDIGHQSTHRRNPSYRRGWVEYTEYKEIDTDRLIIIITGSQAWGREIRDANTLYPTLLEKRLNDSSDESFTVLNWGIPGVDLPEYVIIASQLAQYDPDLVLFIFDRQDMTRRLSRPLYEYGTDVTRLAYFPANRVHLAQTFLDTHQANDPLQAIQNWFYIGVLHTYLLVDEPRAWGHDIKSLQEENHAYASQYDVETDVQPWPEETDGYLANLMGTYLSSIGETPLITITSPTYRGWYTAQGREALDLLVGHFEALWGNLSNVTIMDGIDWIPSDRFYNNTHFDELGHELMAEKLFSVVDDYFPLIR